MRILGILGHFLPVFGLLWPRYLCLMVLMSMFFLVLSGMSEMDKKFQITTIGLEKMPILAILGNFMPVFWPCTNLVWLPDFRR